MEQFEKAFDAYIERLHSEEYHIVFGSISLLLCLKVPLPTAAFQEALQYSIKPFDTERTLPVTDLADFCSLFITTTEANTYAFIDDSVRERICKYSLFEDNSINALAATGCLAYLCSPATTAHRDSDKPFRTLWHEYAARYWADHLSNCSPFRHRTPLKILCDQILSHKMATTPAFTAWSAAAQCGVNGGQGVTLKDWSAEAGKVESTIGEPADAIFVAAACGFNDVLAARIEADSKTVKARSFEFNTPVLTLAAEYGNLEGTVLLLEKGADIEAKDGWNETALMSAARRAQTAAVELLLRKGAKVNTRIVVDGEVQSDDPLHAAAEHGYSEIVQLLLAHGANAKTQSSSGMDALNLAIEGGHEQTVKLLFNSLPADAGFEEVSLLATQLYGAMLDRNSSRLAPILGRWPTGSTLSKYYLDSILWKAASLGDVEAANSLIAMDASANIAHHGYTTLWSAAEEESSNQLTEDLTIVETLLKQGANANSVSSGTAEKLLLCRAAGYGNIELARLLVNNGADVRLAAEDGPTAMYEAVRNGEEEVTRYLLQKGADVDDIGHPAPRSVLKVHDEPETCTLLDAATREEEWDIVKLLKEHGATTRAAPK
ncbi:MAG: hypothetical protein Q9191_001491 [Dirinaria sp. TL-2023a]